MASGVKLRVRRAELIADGVVAIELESMAGLPLPRWTPGAHLEVRLSSGLLRHYSLCGDPEDPSFYRFAVLREDLGGGGSVELHDTMRPGSVLEVGVPRNHFELEPASAYLFLAGGIGITPIVSMLEQSTRDGVPWRLVYGGRTRASMAFLEEIGERGGARVAIVPEDVEGRPDFAAEIAAAPADGLIYACGPNGMLDHVLDVAARLGRRDQVRFERFTGAVPAGPGTPFTVSLRRSGLTFEVGAEESILEAARAQGVNVSFSCEGGYCGKCETVVLDGEPDHRDTYLTDDEKADSFTMMICVSRALGGELVLDL
jgi:ferredoxin-NADP reductase